MRVATPNGPEMHILSDGNLRRTAAFRTTFAAQLGIRNQGVVVTAVRPGLRANVVDVRDQGGPPRPARRAPDEPRSAFGVTLQAVRRWLAAAGLTRAPQGRPDPDAVDAADAAGELIEQPVRCLRLSRQLRDR